MFKPENKQIQICGPPFTDLGLFFITCGIVVLEDGCRHENELVTSQREARHSGTRCNPVLRTQRQEDRGFQIILGYMLGFFRKINETETCLGGRKVKEILHVT